MKVYKRLSLLLCVTLLLPLFSGITVLSETPEIDTLIYSNDFSGELPDSRIVKTGGNGTLEVADGALVLTRTSTSITGVNSSDGYQIYLTEDKTPSCDYFTAISFSVSRSAARAFKFSVSNDDEQEVTGLDFTSSGNINARYKNDIGEEINGAVYSHDCTDNDVEITYAFNHVGETFSLWFDDNLVIENGHYRAESNNLKYFSVQMSKNNTAAVSMRDLKVYTYKITDADSVAYENQLLSFSDISTEQPDNVTMDLEFFAVGTMGCSIEWETSRPDIVSNDGVVTGSAEEDVDVTITAIITKGDNTAKKTFDITVKKIDLTLMPAVKTMIRESDEQNSLSQDDSLRYDFGLSTGAILGIKFNVSGESDYRFSIINTGETELINNETLLEIRKIGNELSAKQNDGTYVTIKNQIPDVCEFTLLIDSVLKKYSLWIGRAKIVDLADTSAQTSSAADAILFELLEGEGAVSDFSVFYPYVPADDAIELDYAYLTFDSLSYQPQTAVSADLRLKTEGRAGSRITWSSSHPDVISDDGVVNSESAVNAITLTAEISNSDEIRVKTFDVNVVEHKKDNKLEIVNLISEEYFDDNTINSAWELDLTGGEIYVENEELTINRTSNVGETMARLFADNDKNDYKNGVYALEYTLVRPTQTFLMYVNGTGGVFSSLQFLSWGAIRHMPDGEVHTTPTLTTNPTVKFTVLCNTVTSTYSVYIDDVMVIKDVGARQANEGFHNMRFYLEGAPCTVKIDSIRFFETYLPHESRVSQDYNYLIERMLVSDDDVAYQYGRVSCDLNLPTEGKNMSNISWESSDHSLVTPQGAVTLAQEGGNDTVTLTATISSGEYAMKKVFTFKIASQAPSDADAAQRDADSITYDVIALQDGGASEIMQSLNLVSNMLYGSTVTWNSSDIRHITHSGRVIRPRWYENDAEVKMTAVIKKGTHTITKTFDFVVLKDKEWKDPQNMTDVEFFGEWNGEEWTVEGKLNYNYPGMEIVGKAAKTGDFELAKERLLQYFSKRASKSMTTLSDRNTLWANALTDGYQATQTEDNFQGELSVKNQWGQYEADLRTDNIAKSGYSSFSIRAWYNESSYAEICRCTDPNMVFRPRIEMMVNGELKTYYAFDDAGVRAGDYKNVNYSDAQTLRVETFGDFLGDNTRYAILKFDFSDLKESDVISSPKLIVYARALPEFSGLKRLIVIKEPSTVWDSKTVTWNQLLGQVYSYNGLCDFIDWNQFSGADIEYYYQRNRFAGYPSAIIAEYLASGDDTYIYKMFNVIDDFINDTGYFRHMGSTSAYEPHNPNGARGGFTRSLDASVRNKNFTKMIDDIAKNELITPELFTSIMKSIWDTADFLRFRHHPSGNWRQLEMESLLLTSTIIPEFGDAVNGTNWRGYSQNDLEGLLFINTLEDGSYVEATAGYNVWSYSGYTNFRMDMQNMGLPVSEEYDRLLHKTAYYNSLLYAPNGDEILYGDGTVGVRAPAPFETVAQLNKDSDLEYIISYGQNGTQPEWTSMHYPLSMMTFMRSDWTTNSPYLFTNVRGGGQHGHADYNHLTVYAYGRTLLTDSGKFSYTNTDPYRVWGESSKAHNTVLINDKSQVRGGNEAGEVATGTIYDWTTNSSFDYLSQSTPATTGFEHRRSVTFIKQQPAMWIVSDLMIPENNAKENNYKQQWFMLPDASPEVSQQKNTIRSTYPSGANLIIANADEDNAELVEAKGWYSPDMGVVQDNPYAYFEKNGNGNVTFDTVLLPSDNDPSAEATVEKLETTTDSTALKINFTVKQSEYTGYYYMTYDNNPGRFGKYSTDGQVAYVQESADGNVTYFMIMNGSYIKDETSGLYLIDSEKKLGELAVDMLSRNIDITSGVSTDVVMANPVLSSEDMFGKKGVTTDVSKTVINVGTKKSVSKVSINNEPASYSLSDGLLSNIVVGSGVSEDIKPPSGGIDDKIKPGQSANGGGGGASGNSGSGGNGGGFGGGMGTVGDVSVNGFPDVNGHWSSVYANELKTRGILQGDNKGNFNPDNNVTRAEFIAMIVRAMNYIQSDYNGVFADVSEVDWYSGVVQTALDNGLISSDVNFRPNDNITRQEMAKVISIAAKTSGKFNDIEIQTSLFGDMWEIADWAREYVDYTYSIGIMNGMPDGCFKPLNNATRGEAAAVISRLLGGK